jgi:hypothetical protein
LHDFAINKLNFKRLWFQDNSPAYCPHYDLTTPRAKKRAIECGATLVTDIQTFLNIIHNTPTYKKWLVESLAVNRGVCPFPSECSIRDKCVKKHCNYDTCVNGYAYRMS